MHHRKGKTGLKNPVYRGLILQIVMVGAMFAFLGPWITGAFLAQAAFAVFLLEYINYIRHYGLLRDVGERQTEMHSWQSEERWSRWTLLELTRHPAHHLKASKPFWELQPYEDAPTLPSGYYGCFWIALIPPLEQNNAWFTQNPSISDFYWLLPLEVEGFEKRHTQGIGQHPVVQTDLMQAIYVPSIPPASPYEAYLLLIDEFTSRSFFRMVMVIPLLFDIISKFGGDAKWFIARIRVAKAPSCQRIGLAHSE